MNEPLLDIVIPTWNNPQYLDQCLNSLYRTGALGTFARAVVINNGDQPIEKQYVQDDRLLVVKSPKNLGWEGGLKLGLEQSNSKFVCFLNDDVCIPQANTILFHRMLARFADPEVAAVGPSTTVAAGIQSIFHPSFPPVTTYVNWLIFFCVIVRREHLMAVGGIDDTLPGGDDFDLCMRLRKQGWKLVFDPYAFLIHHAFVTGSRVRGDHTKPGGWNSLEMTEEVNKALIRKHGFKLFFQTMTSQVVGQNIEYSEEDKEGNLIRASLNGEVRIVELACGARKTVANAIGVDQSPNGEPIKNLFNAVSVADIVADVTQPLPFDDNSQDAIIARHILEHCVDIVSTLNNWKRVLKPGGKLFIAVPDEEATSTIPMNPEHVHAFSRESLKKVMELVGFEHIKSESSQNGISFVGVYRKSA